MAGTNNPFMHYVDDFEKEAEEFLQKYGCSDAINNPQPIPCLLYTSDAADD